MAESQLVLSSPNNDIITGFQYSIVSDTYDADCIFSALSTGIKTIKLLSSVEFEGYRSAICVWGLQNPQFVFANGSTLYSIIINNKFNNGEIDKNKFYQDYWVNLMNDEVHGEYLLLYAAAGFFEVDIFLWDKVNNSKIKLKESFISNTVQRGSRPQIHLLFTGCAGNNPFVGHFSFISEYQYKIRNNFAWVRHRENTFDLRLPSFHFEELSPRTKNQKLPNKNQPKENDVSGKTRRPKKQSLVPSQNISDLNMVENNSVLFTAAEQFHYKWKEVTGLPPSCISDFQEILNKVLGDLNKSIRDNIISRTNNCIIALLFMPSICNYYNGKSKSPSAIKLTFSNVLKANDIVENLLLIRSQYIKEISSDESKPINKPFRKLDVNNNLPSNIHKAVSDFVKAGRTGKAAERLFQAYEGSCSQMFDASGDVKAVIIDKFKQLHPIGNPLGNLQNALPAIQINPDLVLEVISKLPSKSSTGLSSWSNELLKFVCHYKCDSNSLNIAILDNLCSLINAIFNGNGGPAKSWIASFFFFLDKADGGHRPIAVDNIFVRLFGKCISKLKSFEIGDKIKSVQLGVGISGGCEFVAHTVTNWTHEICSSPFSDKIILRIDITNAFNSISRESIQAGIIKFCPSLLNYFNWAYGDATELVLINGKVIGHSSSGIRQGDPLGPMFFCLGFYDPLIKTKEAFPDVDILGYMDDTVIHGNLASSIEALKFFGNELKQIGLTINCKKTLLFGHSSIIDSFNDPELPDISKSSTGFIILGCPVGTSDYINNELENLFNNFKFHLSLLRKVDIQISFILLKFCVNTKWGYYGRVCCPWLIKTFASKIDLEVDKIISWFMGINRLSLISSLVRNLPSSLNIPRFEIISNPGWVSSFIKAFNFAKINFSNAWSWALSSGNASLLNHIHTINLFKTIFPDGMDNFSFNNNFIANLSQKDLTTFVFHQLSDHICSLLRDQKAKLGYFKACIHSKPFWTLWPTFAGSSPSAIFDAEAFKISLKLNLLVDVFPETLQGCHCPCRRKEDKVTIGNPLDDLHCFDCSLVAGLRIARHNAVYNELSRLILKNIPSSAIEPEPLYRYQNKSDKKADIKISLPNGEIFFLDVTICNSGAKSYQDMNIFDLLKDREKNKISQYRHVGFNDNSREFIPFVMDVSGTFGKRALDFINYLHGLESNKSNCFRSLVFKNLNVVLASGLAKTIFTFNNGMNNAIPTNINT
jgi:hypothetical protein